MRLLFADFDLPYQMRDIDHPIGGWSIELKAWLRALRDAGHQAGVLTWRGAREYVGVQDLCELLEAYDPNRGIRVARYFYAYIPGMLAAARAFRPDVVLQACAGVQTGALAFVAQRLGVPFVHRVASDIDVDERYKAKLSSGEGLAFRYGLARSALFLCQNDYQARSLRRRYPAAKSSVIHNPIELGHDLPAIRPRGERRYVAWLGVFKKAKDLPLLERIARSQPTVSFRVGGMPGINADSETAAALTALKTLPNVEMVGYVRRTSVYGFLGQASALLSTSAYEGFSNTFLEAFAAGTPVVARRAVDPDSIIGRNDLGLVADDAPGLSDAVVDLGAMGDEEYSRLTERCRDYVVTNHSGRSKVPELIEAIRPILERSDSPSCGSSK